jgi:hypothetical protein
MVPCAYFNSYSALVMTIKVISTCLIKHINNNLFKIGLNTYVFQPIYIESAFIIGL